MIFLALPDSFLLISCAFLQEGQRVNINPHNIAVAYSYPYLTHSKAKVSRRLHGIDRNRRSIDGQTSALYSLPTYSFCVTSSETSDSEPECQS